MNSIFACLLLLFIPPNTHFIVDIVDVIEINHCYDEVGGLRFDQVIYWDFIRVDDKYMFIVRDWRMLPKDRVREQLTEEEFNKRQRKFHDEWRKKYPSATFDPPYVPPFIDNEFVPHKCGKYYISIFYDEKSKVYRKIYSRSYVETWTQNDPEMDNRKIIPDVNRRKLNSMKAIEPKSVRHGVGLQNRWLEVRFFLWPLINIKGI